MKIFVMEKTFNLEKEFWLCCAWKDVGKGSHGYVTQQGWGFVEAPLLFTSYTVIVFVGICEDI